MQLVRCSIDQIRAPTKPVTVFWAWRDPAGGRHAYRQKLCVDHYVQNVAWLEREVTQERLLCPGCGIDVEDSYTPVYAAVFVPGFPRIDIQAALCDPCSVRVKSTSEIGAESLPDRDTGAANAAPVYSADATLRALGRQV